LHCRNVGTLQGSVTDDVQTATVSAAYGGVTTVLIYVWSNRGQAFQQAIEQFIRESEKKTVLDYSIHCGVRPEFDLIKDIPKVIEMGIRSFKFHLAYRLQGDGRMADYDHIMAALEPIGRRGGIALFHAENGYIIDYLEKKLISEDKTTAEYFIKAHPPISESMATRDCIELGRLVNCPVYIVHVTAKEALDEITAAQARRDVVAVAETCPQYLTLTNDEVMKQGALAKVGPPLRQQEDVDALWEGIISGSISTVGSDHSAATRQAKQNVNFFDARFGMPSTETMLPIMYSEGVAKGRITLPKMVELLCENPAKRFGLYPKKGAIKVGSDADLVVMDPDIEWTVRAADLHSKADYTCFEGWRLRGKPVLSLLRGHVLLKEGALLQKPGFGSFLEQSSVDHRSL
ncbi:dihydroorotase family protein, partial [Chloroflexota bacterium]